MIFRDRVDAGERLAASLRRYRDAPNTVVLGIPRGGIVVARAIAVDLHLPLGICPVRKLGAPGDCVPEEGSSWTLYSGTVHTPNGSSAPALDEADATR